MKKTQEMMGLPIISISDGMEVGKVKSIIINAEKGAIDYIVVESGIQILGARVIPTEYILGIGEYALTIENESAINDISKIPAAIDLLQKNILVRGTKVLTKKGRLIGEIGDIYVDEDESCRIMGLEYIADITQKKIRLIPRSNVITFGKNLIVVTDDVESNLLDNPAQLNSTDLTGGDEKKNTISFDNGVAVNKATDLLRTDAAAFDNSLPVLSGAEIVQDNEIPQEEKEEGPLGGTFQERENTESGHVGAQPSQDDNSAANLFEQRQRQYLSGRKATKTIIDSNGQILITDGDVITEEIIVKVKDNGKMIELVMNNKA
jgi:uncharacterized protein YrrD